MRETAGSPDMPVHMYQIAWHHTPKGGYFQNKKNTNEKNNVLTTVTMNIIAL